MDFFNKAKESLTAAGKGFSQKANEVSGIARVTLKMKEEERQLAESLRELGLQMYNLKNAEAKEMFPELTERISQLYAELEKDRVELAAIKGKKICPNCGTELEAESMCCTACGINVEVAENTVETPVQKFCSNCGGEITEDSKFCGTCGTKVE